MNTFSLCRMKYPAWQTFKIKALEKDNQRLGEIYGLMEKCLNSVPSQAELGQTKTKFYTGMCVPVYAYKVVDQFTESSLHCQSIKIHSIANIWKLDRELWWTNKTSSLAR